MDERTALTVGLVNGNQLAFKFYPDGSQFAEYHSQEILSYRNKVNNYQHVSFNYAFFAYSGYRNIVSTQIQAIQELKNNPFENSLDFNNSINPALFMQWMANARTKEALELVKHKQGNPGPYSRAISRIEHAIKQIINKEAEFVLETDPLNVVIRIEDRTLSFDLLPDGLKSIISWIADLLMRMDRIKWATDVEVLDRNFILFLDEIDVHLHPAWQRKVLPAVQKLFKNAQIFVSTHSPFVVGSVDGAWVHKLVLDEKGNSHAEPPRPSEDGESYQLILKEVFDIDEQFGVGTEEKLGQFKQIKSDILHNRNYDKDQFLKLAHDIAVQSTELQTIIGMELRQLTRIKKSDFSI